MTVKLPPELERYVEQKVAQGEFASQDAFISEAMRLYRTLEARHERLCEDVQAAIDQIERGEGVELADDEELREFFDDIKSRGRERLGAEKQGA